uniref:Uncharacterized protein n=1 Tax=Caloglossa monosticha TaxID=76906 RepID=A0A1Z1M538_9FLOR|nr:hypothetical protein [Caloglossa monosticha]ARW60963.1 hypothetical protein [Caloglossa monosticha]
MILSKKLLVYTVLFKAGILLNCFNAFIFCLFFIK